MLCSLLVAVGGVSILMQNVDIGRTGWNSKETILTPTSVKQLKLLGTMKAVAGCTTQVLYYENLNLNGHKNVMFCWTNGDKNDGNSTVYAFDADTFAEVWSLYIGQSAVWTTHAAAIDNVANHMYFVYKNDNDDGFNYLIGINIMTGKMLPDSHKLINASVPGTGDASVNGQLAFQNTGSPRLHSNCRTSILIVNSVIYFGMAHNSDSKPYHGWVFAYRYDNAFVQVGAFCVTPNGGDGGVWQGGQGIASDGKSIYFGTGNGDYDPSRNNYGMSAIKMSLQLELQDYFTPANWKGYSAGDADLGACGPCLIPNTNYVVFGVTKYGAAHLIDTTNMGKFTANQDACRQTIKLASGASAGGNPVAWNTGNGAKIYLMASSTGLVQLDFNPGTQMINLPFKVWNGNNRDGGLQITSNGMSDAILWVHAGDSIMAFDASKDVSAGPIWTGNALGSSSWGWPTIVNGRVYTNGYDGKISVFGL